MRNRLWAFVVLGCTLPAQESPADPWQRARAILRVAGKVLPDGTWRVEVPRTEPRLVNEYGFPVPASMVLTYAAFAGAPADATVFGDTCVLGAEVNPVVDALREGGIEVVAVHNHMLGGTPNFVFVHFQGRGEATALATTIRAAWDEMEKGHTVRVFCHFAGDGDAVKLARGVRTVWDALRAPQPPASGR